MKSLFAAALLAFVVLPSAQTQTSDATIQALLSEVRQLRIVLERATAAGPRIQITLQRLLAQEQRVAALTQQHAAARDTAARLASLHARFVDNVRNMETRISAEQDAARKQALDLEGRAMAAQVEDHRQQAQQAQLRESELFGALRTETARVDELVQRLSVLEQSLDAK